MQQRQIAHGNRARISANVAISGGATLQIGAGRSTTNTTITTIVPRAGGSYRSGA